MKVIKRLLHAAAAAAAVAFLFTGCSDLFQGSRSQADTPQGAESTVKLYLASGSGVSASVRSAYPSSLADGMLYKVTAVSGSSTADFGKVSIDGSTLSVPLLSGRTWTVTVTVYASADTSCKTALLTGSVSVELTANQASAALSVGLEPASGASGTGQISLQMADDTAAKTISSVTAVYTVSGTTYTTALAGSGSSGWTFSHGTDGTASGASIAAGTYNVVFYFYNSGSTDPAGFYTDEIAVYPGLTTDKWYNSGSTCSDTLSITEGMLSTVDSNTYFVSGTGGAFTGSDTNSGTVISKPFATLTKALAAVNSANDGTSAYTIYVDGTLTEKFADSSTIYCEKIIPTADLTLTVCGLSSAVFDASSADTGLAETAGLLVTSGSDIQNGSEVSGSGTYTVKLTLRNLTLKSPQSTQSSGTAVTGVYMEPMDNSSYFGEGSSLTLEDCTVSAGSTNAYPVYINAGSGNVPAVTLSDGTRIVNTEGNTALYTTGVVTLDSADISITGILQAGTINVTAMPSGTITVEPYSVSGTGPKTLFGTMCTGFSTSSFPLWDPADYFYTDSFTVMPVQTLTTEYEAIPNGYTGYTVNITTRNGQISVPVTGLTDTYLATTIGSNGAIYVVYYKSGSYGVFYAGATGSLQIDGMTGTPAKLALCQVSDGLLLSTGPGSLYKLTSSTTGSTTTWSGTEVTGTDFSDITFTSLASVSKDGTQYVLYTYTDATKTDGPYMPELGCAVLSGTTLTKEWDNDAAVSLKTGDADGVYGKNVCITDMTVGLDGKLYMLLSDTSDKTDFLLNSSDLYLTSRGALVCAGSAKSLASDTAPSVLPLTSYGWRSSSDVTTLCTADGYTDKTIKLLASTDSSYADGYFAGSGRFFCLTPKQITIADSGIYADVDGGSWTTKYGTGVFTLDSSALDLSVPTSEYSYVSLYGESGSGTITTNFSSY